MLCGARLSSEVSLAMDVLGLQRFMGASSETGKRDDGPGTGPLIIEMDEELSLMALAGSLVLEGSTMGCRGWPYTAGSLGPLLTGVEWTEGRSGN